MISKFRSSIFIVSAVCILSCCELYSSRSVVLSMPADPMISAWVVEYPRLFKNGLPVYSNETVAADEKGNRTETIIRIARGVNLPVTAVPRFAFGPAGSEVRITGNFPSAAFYPADVSAGRLELKFEDGFAGELLRSCILNSDAVTCFDTVRFRESITDKAVKPGGAWLLDPVPILSRLGYGLFRESSIKAAENMIFNIPVLSEGSFFSDNPFYPPAGAGNEPLQYSITVGVPVNRRTAFFNAESGEVIEVYFDDKQWCWTNLLSGASESGRR